jgi:hypothetical protein
MQSLRRLILAASFLSAIVCIILLLNFTAPNPTGRRYSSEIAPYPQSISVDGGESGFKAERILSKDLKTPHNNEAEQKCVCASSYAPNRSPGIYGCNVCTVYSNTISGRSFFVPDFVTASYIAESKNTRPFPPSGDKDQLTNFVLMATNLKMPLWVFVRQDTQIDSAFAAVIANTGGGVVRYFTYPGYIDPVDLAAWRGLAISLLIFLVALILPFGVRRIHWTHAPKPPKDPMKEAIRKSNDLKDFKDRATQRAPTRIDIEDSRRD